MSEVCVVCVRERGERERESVVCVSVVCVCGV